MSLPRYESYKDSGVEWLGEVPSHWEILPFYGVASERKEPNIGMVENNLLSLSYGRIIQKDISTNDGLLPESFETYQIVRHGDIIFRLTDLQNDKRSLRTAIVEDEKGIITSAYLSASPFDISSNYLSHLLRAYDVVKVFYSMGGGLRQSMKFSDVKRLPILVPTKSEQTAIAAFLDHETAKIDELIAEQQRLVELLKEKRQAVISHAVTKGLNPAAPMKDSGIEWLGEVPSHWEVKRLKFLCNVQTGDKDTVNAVETGEYPFFVRSQTIEHIDSFTFDCEAVLTAGDGAGVGKVFHYINGKFDFHQRVYMMNNFRFITGVFFFWYISATFYKVALEGGAKSTVDSLRMPLFMNFSFTVPPIQEQQDIVTFLDRETAKMDELTTEAKRAITFLQERRTALISAAVTGKIDVRGVELQPERTEVK
jgi:type I restriction enzyme S subunit